MFLRLLIFISLFFVCNLQAFASHIVGGVMYYDCLGNNNYKITVKLYRDCNSNGAQYDPDIPIGIFDGNNNYVKTVSASFPGSTHLSVVFNNPCVNPPSDICTEEAIYTVSVNLPANSSGYILSFQRCCRGPNVINLINPAGSGLTLVSNVPPAGQIPCNSSPRFTNYPPLVLCAGEQLVFDNSATDPDGDNLVYSFTSPFVGGTSVNPAPNPPDNPPYFPVTWEVGYSSSLPLSASANAQINSTTGLLTASPSLIGLYVVGICVKEYRNGVYIGQTIRDFLFRVVDCQVQNNASITPQTNLSTFQSFCQGLSIQFENQSTNGTHYHWDFGVSSETNDTSNVFAPSYTYPSDGTYNVTLILNPGWPCTDTSVQSFQVHSQLVNSYIPPSSECIIGNSFDFIGTGNYDSTASSYLWDFGPHASPSSDTTQTPNNITFDTSGYIPIKYTVHWDACVNDFKDSIFIYRVPTADFFIDTALKCVPYTANFLDESLSDAPITYLWDFGDGGSSTQANPSHVYDSVGVYDVSMTMSVTQGCTDTLTVVKIGAIDVKPTPTAGFLPDPIVTDVFHTKISFYDQSFNNVEVWYYFSPTDSSDIRNTTHTYIDGGYYYPYQIVTNEYGCKNKITHQIYIIPFTTLYVPNTFTPNGDGKNEVFLPIIKDQLSYHFEIFDRWGNLVFQTNDANQGWDGQYKGEKSPDGTYVYELNFIPPQDGFNHLVRGHVNLLR